MRSLRVWTPSVTHPQTSKQHNLIASFDCSNIMSPLPYIRYSFHSLRNHLFSRWIDRSADTQISSQWRGPQDVLSILLILGPDIIQRALAQLAGSHITPVVFSFGWVAYAFSALLAAFGSMYSCGGLSHTDFWPLTSCADGRLVPEADFSAIVIGAKSGNQRSNRSWVIGRLLRDHEQRSSKLKYHNDKTYGKHEALRVTVFEVADSPKPGTIARDWVYYSGFVVAVAQLGMAAIPTILAKNWSIMMITVMGNVLALLQGAMPHWRKEKWAAPSNGGYTVSITQGNGSQHVMVVLANEFTGFDLEILAGGGRNIRVTRQELIYISSLTVCWTALLISVAGLSEDSWCKFS
jgi:hypothetical protein